MKNEEILNDTLHTLHKSTQSRVKIRVVHCTPSRPDSAKSLCLKFSNIAAWRKIRRHRPLGLQPQFPKHNKHTATARNFTRGVMSSLVTHPPVTSKQDERWTLNDLLSKRITFRYQLFFKTILKIDPTCLLFDKVRMHRLLFLILLVGAGTSFTPLSHRLSSWKWPRTTQLSVVTPGKCRSSITMNTVYAVMFAKLCISFMCFFSTSCSNDDLFSKLYLLY